MRIDLGRCLVSSCASCTWTSIALRRSAGDLALAKDFGFGNSNSTYCRDDFVVRLPGVVVVLTEDTEVVAADYL